MYRQDKQPHPFIIGVAGCGHLGQAIAKALVEHGVSKQRLLLSHRGSPETSRRLEALGLTPCVCDNQTLFGQAQLVFVATRPQDVVSFRGVPGGACVVSLAAGLPFALLEKIFGHSVCRAMLSGPDTLLNGTGVAIYYPENPHVRSLLDQMGLCVHTARSEGDLDIFTAGVCLPAALLWILDKDKADAGIAELENDYPLLSELYPWAKTVTPSFQTDAEKDDYIEAMTTKGGVTDAIIRALKAQESFAEAMRKGISRSREISLEAEKALERV